MAEARVRLSADDFVSLVDALAQTEMFTEADVPIILGHPDGGGNPFPCIDTDDEALRTLNAERDAEDRARRKNPPKKERTPVNTRSIQDERYWVAIPRTGAHRHERAIQLLEACVDIQRERRPTGG